MENKRKCLRFKMTPAGRRCADFSPKGHGVLSVRERKEIREGIHPGKFGGKGTFSSLAKCKAEVRKQKAKGVPYSKVSKRIVLPTKVFAKRNPKLRKLGDKCLSYARKIYGKD